MTKSKTIGILLTLFVVLPIWFFLLYSILESVNASELMWFLYWIYVPAILLCSAIAKIAGEK